MGRTMICLRFYTFFFLEGVCGGRGVRYGIGGYLLGLCVLESYNAKKASLKVNTIIRLALPCPIPPCTIVRVPRRRGSDSGSSPFGKCTVLYYAGCLLFYFIRWFLNQGKPIVCVEDEHPILRPPSPSTYRILDLNSSLTKVIPQWLDLPPSAGIELVQLVNLRAALS